MSSVACQMSRVICHVSCAMRHVTKKVVKLVGGGSVINKLVRLIFIDDDLMVSSLKVIFLFLFIYCSRIT